MTKERECLTKYNGLFKENDEIYRKAAKKLGLSDGVFWILYSLRDAGGDVTLSVLCGELYMPKQTVHSALKKMEQEGYICFSDGRDRRSRYIRLTEKGSALAADTVDRVIEAETAAFSGLSGEEREAFISVFHKYTGLLRHTMKGAVYEH